MLLWALRSLELPTPALVTRCNSAQANPPSVAPAGPPAPVPPELCFKSPKPLHPCAAPVLFPPHAQLFIDGKWVDAVSGKRMPVVDPRTESVVLEVAEGDAADVDKAVAAARKAFDQGPWPRMTAKASHVPHSPVLSYTSSASLYSRRRAPPDSAPAACSSPRNGHSGRKAHQWSPPCACLCPGSTRTVRRFSQKC